MALAYPNLNGATFGSGGLPQTTSSASGHTHGLVSGAHSHSVFGPTTSPMANAAVKNKRIMTRFADFKPGMGFRIPDIDRKLQTMADRVVEHQHGYRHLPSEVAIEVLGKYNPMYAGRPKKLTMSLLNRVEAGRNSGYPLHGAGLMYYVPALVGIRATRERTTSSAYELLEYWAANFPKFKPFFDAYTNKKAKTIIYSECFDLMMNVRPASFLAIDKANELNTIKHEARLYRKEKKAREIKEKNERDRLAYEENQRRYNDMARQQQNAYNDLHAYNERLSQQNAPSGMGMVPLITSQSTANTPNGLLGKWKGVLGG